MLLVKYFKYNRLFYLIQFSSSFFSLRSLYTWRKYDGKSYDYFTENRFFLRHHLNISNIFYKINLISIIRKCGLLFNQFFYYAFIIFKFCFIQN